MKKIALIHHTGELGGGTKSLVDLAKMLCDQYEIVICVPKGSLFEAGFVKGRIKVHGMESGIPYLNFFSGSSPLISKASLNSLRSLFQITDFCNEIKKLEPDLVLFNSIVTSVSSLKLNKIKCAVIDRETMTNPLYIKLYNRIINKNIRGIAFLCRYEKNKFLLRKDMIRAIIPDCVPKEDFIHLEEVMDMPENGTYKALYMGGSSSLKGAHTVLKAATKLNEKIIIIIAGKFDVKRFSKKNILKHIYNPAFCIHLMKLSRAYEKVKNSKNVVFVGLRANIYPLIKKSDIVIFPSSKAHQPRPCIEAGYFKKPVLISDFKETQEYFKDGYNAFTFKPNSAADLVRCIRYAYGHRNEMEVMGRHNFEMSMEFHDYEKTKVKLNHFIGLILKK